VKRETRLLLFAFLFAAGLLAQTPPSPGTSAPPLVPDLIQRVPPAHSHSGFLKNLTLRSFGYSLAPLAPGYEFESRPFTGPFDATSLECPRCIIRSPVNRTRYSLPAFGSEATLKLWSGHAEMFTGFGGVNGWRADNTGLETGALSFRRDSSFNDAWLVESSAGVRVAVDRGKHVWLGAAYGHVENYRSDGPRRWRTLSANVTFVFGH